MCNLYRLKASSAEIAGLFRARPTEGLNHAEDVYPGYSGLVIAQGTVQSMTWGFPLAQTSKKTGKPLKPKPVNNAREDKLRTPFWRHSFESRRCLIPVSAWAEAEGETGKMTRTWYSLPRGAPFAVGGVWRPSEEWGKCYSMVMVDGCKQMAEVHDRMPVILREQDWQIWTDGEPAVAFTLCRPWDQELAVDRTADLWRK